MIIRAKTFRAWFNANLKSHAKDIANHGADCGWTGITTYADTVKLFDRFQDEIWEMLASMADDMGQSVPELIASFRRADMCETPDGFKNLLVWFACEEIARELSDA
jgi:hypothetical protein